MAHTRGVSNSRPPVVHAGVPSSRSVEIPQSSKFLIINQIRTRPSASNNDNMRLTQAEYQDKRDRNQCFFCDKTFKPDHNCRKG